MFNVSGSIGLVMIDRMSGSLSELMSVPSLLLWKLPKRNACNSYISDTKSKEILHSMPGISLLRSGVLKKRLFISPMIRMQRVESQGLISSNRKMKKWGSTGST